MRLRPWFVVFLVSLAVLPVSSFRSGSRSAAETESWRSQRERDLKSDTGWLTVAGLTFLKPGANSVGSDRDSDVVLPPAAPKQAGELTREDRSVWFTPAPGSGILLNGAPVTEKVQLKAKDRLSSGGVSFHLHQSGERVGVRIRDVNSALRRSFRGLRWFPVREAWTVDAKFVAYDQPRVATVANVLGDYEQLTIPGEVVFQVEGQDVRLQAAQAGKRLWLIFSDATAPRETYRIRFLYADAPSSDGRVTIDFNRAYNPPCAYNPFTTCPVPPPENRLKIPIAAGERIPHP
jgi:uncharacterized protein (DUF1684 family)